MKNPEEYQSEPFTIVGSVGRALWVYAGPFTIGVVLTYIFFAMFRQSGQYLWLSLIVLLFVYVFWDLVQWLIGGVRTVELDSGGLTVTRVGSTAPVRVRADEITAVYVTKSFDRITVRVMLRGSSVTSTLGIRRYSGPRIRITVEPFDRKEFAEFAERIKNLRRAAPQE
ncbi:MAG TPA: hypothetical protein VMM37_01545 [Bacteroidota bacterium]|nr:hypothetical protein [Bacteroidota bacterium]